MSHGRSAGISRRGFLMASGATVAAGVVAGCDGPGKRSRTPRPPTSDDLARIGSAAAVDVLAVQMYDLVIAAGRQGRLGSMPPAVLPLWQALRAHHSDHARSANTLLSVSHRSAIGQPDRTLGPTVLSLATQARDLSGVATAALLVENAAAATHQDNAANLSGTAATLLATGIAPVEAQHVALWNLLLGHYPGSLDHSGTTMAFTSTAGSRAGKS